MASREHFASRIGFILAAAGSAIGIGAIWKFPYMVGTNGGSVFIFLFIICTLLLGLPILIAEFMIGRRGQTGAIQSFKKQAPHRPWFLIGWLGVITSGLILSFYSVVGGWILSYLLRAITFRLSGQGIDFSQLFQQVIENPLEVIIAQGAFMLITLLIVQAGVKDGIEVASKWMMPLLFIFFVLLCIRSITLDGAMEGVRFMFVPDWSYFNSETFLLALGQAFFSLSVGICIMVTYASYLPKEENIVSSGVNVATMNIIISLLAGLVIFPAVFALGYSPTEGPGLVFMIIPAVFEQLPFGQILLIIFFILLLFATITSAISLLEVVVSNSIGERLHLRKKAAWLFAALIFIIGIPSALSFGTLSNITFFNKSIFDFIDYLTNSIAMPVGALFISWFAGYYYEKQLSQQELQTTPLLFTVWYTIVRYIAPIAIVVILIRGIINYALV
ncbi:sodium-dependent transporter [Lysinibacillus louembei]|uniref:Sodium-dependent transporter n=1 Tax=Lysinibacillus louembei TaxID=1470088 RepID=A0ABZ0RTR6_9BACI|nr:sodium-dependent transporter [Lysinibacillus louembei]WPK10474.1 sodium-dependent transporter [Lysinibacillus louembei]